MRGVTRSETILGSSLGRVLGERRGSCRACPPAMQAPAGIGDRRPGIRRRDAVAPQDQMHDRIAHQILDARLDAGFTIVLGHGDTSFGWDVLIFLEHGEFAHPRRLFHDGCLF